LDGIADLTMQTTQFALDGLAQRGDARANNIANVNTPGFHSSGVSFESALSTALGRGDVPDTSKVTTFDTEMTGNVKDSLTYEAMINGFNYKVSVLRQAIGGKP